jgi:hypothetical protein
LPAADLLDQLVERSREAPARLAFQDLAHARDAIAAPVCDLEEFPTLRAALPPKWPTGSRIAPQTESSSRAITSRWISLVPSPMVQIFESR